MWSEFDLTFVKVLKKQVTTWVLIKLDDIPHVVSLSFDGSFGQLTINFISVPKKNFRLKSNWRGDIAPIKLSRFMHMSFIHTDEEHNLFNVYKFLSTVYFQSVVV